MPRFPTISAVLALYLAGLLAGLGDSVQVAAFGALVLAGWAFVYRNSSLLAFGCILVAGTVVGHTTAREGDRCAAGLSEGPIQVYLDTPAARGSFVRGRSPDCGVRVSLLVVDGEFPAGTTVLAAGDISRSASSVVVRNAVLLRLRPPTALSRLRTRAATNIDSAFGENAPLARALLVADTKNLAPELRDRFAAAGMAHILSISGLHVGIIAVAIELVLGLLRVPRRYAPLLALAVIVGYVAMLGARPPAVRATVMLAVRSMTRLAERPTSPWAMLTIGAMQPVISPRTVLDIGYQLSVVGVASLIAAAHLMRRLKLSRRPAWRHELIGGIIGSTAATIATAPLVLWFFGRVSLVGPLSNIVAAPLIAILQPMLFFALVLSPFPAAMSFVADAAHPLLVALDRVALFTASIPGANLHAWATPAVAVLAAIACCSVILACMHDRPTRPAMVTVAAAAAIIWLPSLPVPGGATELHLIDVGQGDAIALRTPAGRWIVFDAGRSWRGGDAARFTLIPYIARRGGRFDTFILSHPHTDHVGGAASLIRRLKPDRYFDAAFAAPNVAYLSSLQAAQEARVRWARVRPGDSLVVDGVSVLFLAPDSAWTVSLRDPNNASTVALVRIGNVRILLTGDAEAEQERWLLDRWGERLRADILKVGHHGSSTSSTDPFLDAVQPRLALISVGAANTYRHPSPDVVDALVSRGAQVLRTDLAGSVVVRTDGRRVTVEALGAKWDLPQRDPSGHH